MLWDSITKNCRTNSSRESSSTEEQAVIVQAATTVGEMKTQTLCFRPIGKNRASTHSPFVIPVPFSKYHQEMLAHCSSNGYMSINPRFNKLITSLRTAVEGGLGNLDKEATIRFGRYLWPVTLLGGGYIYPHHYLFV